MDLKIIDVDVEIDKVVKALEKKKAYNFGFIRYSVFKKIIIFTTKIKNNYLLRKIFLKMIDKELIIKEKNSLRSYIYKFKNQNETLIKTHQVTISF